MRLPVEYVELRSEDGRLGPLQALLGNSAITPSGGGGGWEPVARPGRRPILVWRAPDDPYRLLVPLLFDGFRRNESVEADCRLLERMAGVNVPGDPEPPLLIVEGSLPHDESRAESNRWVIEKSPEWGEAIRREEDGHRIRQAVTIQLALFTEDTRLTTIRRPSPEPMYPVALARKGDTYEKVAARELKPYGGARLGARLARLNDKRSPDVKLAEGSHVRLPTVEAAQDWHRDLKAGR
jgi:hypothetical protein